MQENWRYKDRNVNGIVDCYAHIAALIPNAYSYHAMCVGAMDAMRNANNYRPKLYPMPDQTAFTPLSSNGLTPFTDFYTQVRMLAGTYIMGMTLTVYPENFTLQNNFYVDVTDDGAGVPFFTGWVSETQFLVPVAYNDASGITGRSTYTGKFPWFPFTKPRPVSEPGIVSVGMCAKYNPSTSSNIAPQLVLVCAEPCNVLRNVQECR